MNIEITKLEFDKIALLILTGAFNESASISYLNTNLKKLLQEGFYKIIVNFDQVTEIISSAMGVLVESECQCAQNDGDMFMVCKKDSIFWDLFFGVSFRKPELLSNEDAIRYFKVNYGGRASPLNMKN